MSTYEELSLIVSVALLIVTILNYTKKIARPDPAKVDELFSIVFLFAGMGKWWFPSGFRVCAFRRTHEIKRGCRFND